MPFTCASRGLGRIVRTVARRFTWTYGCRRPRPPARLRPRHRLGFDAPTRRKDGLVRNRRRVTFERFSVLGKVVQQRPRASARAGRVVAGSEDRRPHIGGTGIDETL